LPINTPSAEYVEAARKWKRIQDCLDGRDAIVAGGTEYASKVGTTEDEQREYVQRGHFFNATSRTREGMRGAIMAKPPVVNAPPVLDDVLKDMSPRGIVPIETFAARGLDELIPKGRVGVLVDGDIQTVDGKEQFKPYAVIRKPEDIIAWETMKIGADEILSRVVLREWATGRNPEDPQGPTGRIEKFRELFLASGPGGELVYQQQLYKKQVVKGDEGKEEETWVTDGAAVVPERVGKTLDRIPFLIVGPQGVSPDVAPPPMIDLADANIAHWRNSCELEHGLYLVALPTPWFADMQIGDKPPTRETTLGPGRVKHLMQGSQAGMLEFSGSGLAAISEAMKSKRDEMATLGAALIETEAVNETATSVALRHSGQNSVLVAISRNWSMALVEVLRWMAWFVDTAARPSDIEVAVELNSDFAQTQITAAEAAQIVTNWQAGMYSWATAAYLLQRGNFWRPGVTPEQELSDLEAERGKEPPPEGGTGGGNPNPWSVRRMGEGDYRLVNGDTGEMMAGGATPEEAATAMKAMMGGM
jgi:hypothetical protein